METLTELQHNLRQIAHHHVFLRAIGVGTSMVASEFVPTLSTDSESVFFNPNLITKKPFDDAAVRRFALAHILMHRALNHPFRLPPPHIVERVDFGLWSLAQDIVVNNIIMSMQTSRLAGINARDKREQEIKSPLFRPPRDSDGKLDLVFNPEYNGWSAERIYVDLQSKTKAEIKAKYAAIPSGSKPAGEIEYKHHPVTETPLRWDGQLDSHIYYDPSTPEAQETICRQENCVINAISQAKTAGHGTGDAWRALSNDIGRDPSLDAALEEILVAMERAEYSWNKLQRRWLPSDLYFPTMIDEKGAELVVGIDVSGSIGQKELAEFWSIIRGMIQGGMKLKLHLVSCDAAITSVHKVSWDEPETLEKIKELPGGGGTDFTPVFKWMDKNVPEAQGLIFFTDLCGTFPSEPPPCPTFWLVDNALKNRMKVPFGQVIYYQPGALTA